VFNCYAWGWIAVPIGASAAISIWVSTVSKAVIERLHPKAASMVLSVSIRGASVLVNTSDITCGSMSVFLASSEIPPSASMTLVMLSE
jgi:hypothetical protein